MPFFSFLILPFGFFVPGLLVARRLRHRLPWLSAFFLSELVLFHSIFWIGVLHIPITLWTVLPCLAAVSAAAFWLRCSPPAAPAQPKEPSKPLRGEKSLSAGKKPADKPSTSFGVRALAANLVKSLSPGNVILTLGTLAVGVFLIQCVIISPLSGGDTRFRWDFLAEKILARSSFAFYPPLTPADFRTYFFVDGIPPLASFTHWWLYASAGGHTPVLISLLVGAEFVCTLAFTYAAAAALYSPRAGVLAAAILSSSPLYLKALIIAQETGLTALAISAVIYFVVTAKPQNSKFAMISAGLAAALCALSREYGWIAVIAGAIALFWRRRPRKDILLFAGVAAACALPWYARNTILTGNPFYSLSFLGFPVNPIHDGFMQYYRSNLGVGNWTQTDLGSLFQFLLYTAPLQLIAGPLGILRDFRRSGYLAVIALLLIAVWVQAAAFTSGGLIPSTRVLSPGMVVLSIMAAGALDVVRLPPLRLFEVAGILFCQLWAILHVALYPWEPNLVPSRFWTQNAFHQYPDPIEFRALTLLYRSIPQNKRVLTDSAYAHAALAGLGVDVVPVWSPEVRFLFSESFEESSRRLLATGFGAVIYYPDTLNSNYLSSVSQFYAELPVRWHLQRRVSGKFEVLAP